MSIRAAIAVLLIAVGAVLLVALCVAISRSLGFLPGYVIGLPAGLSTPYTTRGIIASQASRARDAAIGRSAVMAALVAGALAWLLSWPLEALSVVSGIQSALLAVFLIALQFALFDLLPIASTTGRLWFEQHRLTWGVVFAAVAFVALHTLFNPNRAGLDALRNPGLLPLGAVVAATSGVTLVAWLLTNESRLRDPQGLNRRSTLAAGALMATWLGGVACVALAEAASTFDPAVVLVGMMALAVVGAGAWMWSKRRARGS